MKYTPATYFIIVIIEVIGPFDLSTLRIILLYF